MTRGIDRLALVVAVLFLAGCGQSGPTVPQLGDPDFSSDWKLVTYRPVSEPTPFPASPDGFDATLRFGLNRSFELTEWTNGESQASSGVYTVQGSLLTLIHFVPGASISSRVDEALYETSADTLTLTRVLTRNRDPQAVYVYLRLN